MGGTFGGFWILKLRKGGGGRGVEVKNFHKARRLGVGEGGHDSYSCFISRVRKRKKKAIGAARQL